MLRGIKYHFVEIKQVLVKYEDGKEETTCLLWMRLDKDGFVYYISGPTIVSTFYDHVNVTELDGSAIDLSEAVI